MGRQGRHGRRAVAGVLAVLWTAAGSAATHVTAGGSRDIGLGPPLTQAKCSGVKARVSVFHPGGVPVDDWREELAFDGHGGMWVSHIEFNTLERYDPRGRVTETLAVPGSGGLVLGPDGLIYANTSGGPAGTGVVRFDPTLAHPTLSVFVSGLPGVNASTFDSSGFLYVSTEGQPPSVLRIRPDGTRDTAWERAAAFYGANGVTVVGANLYGAVSFDQRSPIELVPIGNPAAHRTFAELSFGVLSRQPKVYRPDLHAPLIPKGLDDLTTGPDGLLYVVGFASGELLRVNPTTGQACVLASGLRTPTAVQFAVNFGSFDPSHDLFLTEASGRIMHVHLDMD
jgi:hypothetical protein